MEIDPEVPGDTRTAYITPTPLLTTILNTTSRHVPFGKGGAAHTSAEIGHAGSSESQGKAFPSSPGETSTPLHSEARATAYQNTLKDDSEHNEIHDPPPAYQLM